MNLTVLAAATTAVDTTPPVLLGCALPPAPAVSPASPRSDEFVVDCGTASDACDSQPLTQTAELRVQRSDVVDGACVPVEELVPVDCGEVVELRLLAAPCPARPPKSPRVAVSVRSDGVKVVLGESIELEVTASDACDNTSPPCVVDAATLCLERPEPPRCPVPLCP
jgi:hypothetical protein